MALLALILITSSIDAQSSSNVWKSPPDDPENEYNCATLSTVLAEAESPSSALFDAVELPFMRLVGNRNAEISFEKWAALTIATLSMSPRTEVNFTRIIRSAASACSESAASGEENSQKLPFNVVTSSKTGMRSCARNDCEVIAQIEAGTSLTVIGIEGLWYQVDFSGQSAFIPSMIAELSRDSVSSHIPVISLDEVFHDSVTDCMIVFDQTVGATTELDLIIIGRYMNSVQAVLYLPSEDNPLEPVAQLQRELPDTGQPYIQHFYGSGFDWVLGRYSLELTLNDKRGRFEFDLQQPSAYKLIVLCD